MYLNNIDEVEVALGERYDGPTYEVNKGNQGTFTYVPWTESVELLDQVFGVFGWSASAPQVVSANGFVHVSFGITVRVWDPETESVIEKTVPAIGSATERDDNTAKSAFSDAFNKGVKLLGDKFARYLSKEGKANRQPTQTQRQAPQQQAGGYRPQQGNGQRPAFNGSIKEPGAPATDAQLRMLKLKGFDGDTSGLTKGEASELINSLN